MKQYLYEITSQNKNCDYGCSNDESIFLISRNKYSFFEFENICETVYEQYLDSIEEPDIWWLVNDELIKRGYKEV